MPSEAAAIKFYKTAADQNHVPAQRKLGDLYAWKHGRESMENRPDSGCGLVESIDRARAPQLGKKADDRIQHLALHYWRRAAELGDAQSQFNLGRVMSQKALLAGEQSGAVVGNHGEPHLQDGSRSRLPSGMPSPRSKATLVPRTNLDACTGPEGEAYPSPCRGRWGFGRRHPPKVTQWLKKTCVARKRRRGLVCQRVGRCRSGTGKWQDAKTTRTRHDEKTEIKI